MDYSAQVRQRFLAARAAAEQLREVPGAAWGEAGDRVLNVWVRFQVQSHAGHAGTIRYEVFGCPHTVAAADWLAEQLPGRAVAQLADWDVHELAAILEIPVEKTGKLLVLQDALAACRDGWAASDDAHGSERSGSP